MGRAIESLLEKEGFLVWSLDTCALPGEHFIKTDITDSASVEQAYERIKQESGGIDAVVHAAGIYEMNSLVEMSQEDFERIFRVNFFAMARMNRVFLPLFRPGARVVMISSELAPLDPLPFTGLYAIVKNTVEKYAYSLRMELQLLGYRVSVIRPGAVKTSFLDQSQQKIERFCKSTVLYKDTSRRFLNLVNRIETATVEPRTIAEKVLHSLNAVSPKYVYNVNRSPLLLLLNALPQRLQNYVIRRILTKEKH